MFSLGLTSSCVNVYGRVLVTRTIILSEKYGEPAVVFGLYTVNWFRRVSITR